MPVPLVELSGKEIAHRIEKRARALKGVARCKVVSISSTRKKPSVHLHVVLRGNPTFEETHVICSMLGIQVRKVLFNVHAVILSESGGLENEGEIIGKIVRTIAEQESGFRGAQNIHVREIDGGRVGVDFVLHSGSAQVSARSLPTIGIEKKLFAADPRISEVVIHEESLSELVRNELSSHGSEARWYIEHVGERFPNVRLRFPPGIRRIGDELRVTVRVSVVSTGGHEEMRATLSEFVVAIENGYPAITEVDAIEEPEDKDVAAQVLGIRSFRRE